MDANGEYVSHGQGNSPCALAIPAAGLSRETIDWTAGFLTAVNVFMPQTYAVSGGMEALTWLRQYCALNPQQELADAMIAFVRTVWPTQQVIAPDPVLPPPPQPKAPQPMPVRSRKRS